jgi:hypothetical protein
MYNATVGARGLTVVVTINIEAHDRLILEWTCGYAKSVTIWSLGAMRLM